MCVGLGAWSSVQTWVCGCQLTPCILNDNCKAITSIDEVIVVTPLNLNVKTFISFRFLNIIKYLNIDIGNAFIGVED